MLFSSQRIGTVLKTTHSFIKEMKNKTTTDGIKILDAMIGDDAELQEMCDQATVNAHVAQLIYDARTEANLSQQALADMIGTTQSVISRLEDADYKRHSLSMLNRVAQALNREVKIDLVPTTQNDNRDNPLSSRPSL